MATSASRRVSTLTNGLLSPILVSIGKTKKYKKVSGQKGLSPMTNTQTPAAVAEPAAVHPMKKSYTFVSTKHVDYDNLSHLEAATMSLALVLAVTIGVLQSTVLS